MSNPVIQPIQPRRNGRTNSGCFLSCLVVIALSLVIVLVASVGLYMFVVSAIDSYTADAPIELPEVHMSGEETAALEARIAAFAKSLQGEGDIRTLRLNAHEINVLMKQNERHWGPFARHLHLTMNDGIISGQMSLPLSEMGLGARYFNGSAELAIGLEGGVFFVFLKNLQVGDVSISETMLAELTGQNLARDVVRSNPEVQQHIDQLASIHVEDDVLVITAKEKATP